MSRGISQSQAIRFLAEGFLNDIVERLPIIQQIKGRAILANAFDEFMAAEL
jgi:Fe-S cluster assembly scaffold protein SufB